MPYTKRKSSGSRRAYSAPAKRRKVAPSKARRTPARAQTIRIELVHKAETPANAAQALPITPTVTSGSTKKARL